MKRSEEREFLERERVARDLWRIVRTSLGNQVGWDNPYLAGVFAHVESEWPWLIEKAPPSD